MIHHRKEEEKAHHGRRRRLSGRVREVAEAHSEGRHQGLSFVRIFAERRNAVRAGDGALRAQLSGNFVQYGIHLAVLRRVAVVRKVADGERAVAPEDPRLGALRDIDDAYKPVAARHGPRIRRRMDDRPDRKARRSIELFDERCRPAALIEIDHGNRGLEHHVVGERNRKGKGRDERNEDGELLVGHKATAHHGLPFRGHAFPDFLHESSHQSLTSSVMPGRSPSAGGTSMRTRKSVRSA